MLIPNLNECNSALTNGTKNIYPYIDVNDQGHQLRKFTLTGKLEANLLFIWWKKVDERSGAWVYPKFFNFILPALLLAQGIYFGP